MRRIGSSHHHLVMMMALLASAGLGGIVWHAVAQEQKPAPGSPSAGAPAPEPPAAGAKFVPPSSIDPGAVSQAKGLSRAFRAVAMAVQPTVVKIKTSAKSQDFGTSEDGTRRNPFKGTPFEDYFGDDETPGFRFHPRIPRREGVGSGVIIDPSGLILTNNHVVEDADEILVELPGGQQYKADEIKTDPRTDLAVVRIKAAEPLPAAPMGDSDTLEIGDWVLAVGSQFELDGSVTAGIISGKGRSLSSNRRAEFLQTDAAINPGNSGGPLVNLDGEVVGINTAIASVTGGYQGVGFAIPINLAKWVTKQLIETGTVQRAYLGVQIAEIDANVARKLGVRRGDGVLVAEVFPDTPAAAAGFQTGDVIRAFAGHAVTNPRELQEIVERSPAGSKQKVDVVRDGKPVALSVVVKPLPNDFETAAAPVPGGPKGGSSGYADNALGLRVGELTGEAAKELGYEGVAGVLIAGVDENGIASEAGITEGMVILRVGKKPVKSVADFKAAMASESLKDGILLLIRTPDGNRFVVLQSS